MFQADGEVAVVGFGDGNEAELEAGAARGDLDLWGVLEDLLDVEEDAVGLGERGAGGGEVIEDEGTLVHLREQVGGELGVGEVAADNE